MQNTVERRAACGSGAQVRFGSPRLEVQLGGWGPPAPTLPESLVEEKHSLCRVRGPAGTVEMVGRKLQWQHIIRLGSSHRGLGAGDGEGQRRQEY